MANKSDWECIAEVYDGKTIVRYIDGVKQTN